ncbi:MAG: hypothetical protein NDI84_16270 [Steroidobacteraceae bacterium]|nr:hypothetical protein [Steroidobacteraceae bacterium]
MRTPARVISLCARGVAIGLLALVLGACSRTVTWEEEVPLNTQSTTWVVRTDTYSRSTEPGNPFKAAWVIATRSVDVSLHERRYEFEAATADIFMVVDRGNTISVVAWSNDCSKRGYAEYRWIRDTWRRQASVDPSLTGQPRNLMGYFSPVDDAIPARVSVNYKKVAGFHLPQRGGHETTLSPSRLATDCLEK